MTLGRLVLAFLCMATLTSCDTWRSPATVQSQAAIKRVYWGLPQDGPGANVTSMVTCPDGFPCDLFANSANFNDSKPDMNKRLTVVWTCDPQHFVLSDVVLNTLKMRVACVGGPPTVPRTISIIEASWGSGGSGSAVDVTQQVRDICGEGSVRCQVPAMAYILGNADRNPKVLRVRFTCNGERTPGQSSMENGVVDLRCERNADLGFD